MYLYNYVEYIFMQIVIEWIDKQGDVVCTRDTGRWLEGETSAEVCITPIIPKIEGDSKLTKHAIRCMNEDFAKRIVGFNIKVLEDK